MLLPLLKLINRIAHYLFAYTVPLFCSVPSCYQLWLTHRHLKIIDCLSLFTVPATSAAQNSLLFFFFLLRLLTELISKQGRPWAIYFTPSISMDSPTTNFIECMYAVSAYYKLSMHQLAGQNLGRVLNSRSGILYSMQLPCFETNWLT